MLKALRNKHFKIDRQAGAGTVIVTHAASTTEVLRALQIRGTNWAVRHADNLFEQPVKPVTAADILG
jgi:hypothetical protein